MLHKMKTKQFTKSMIKIYCHNHLFTCVAEDTSSGKVGAKPAMLTVPCLLSKALIWIMFTALI